MTQIYLAYGFQAEYIFSSWDWEADPVSLLVAYPYAERYLEKAQECGFKPAKTILDSGAYTVWKSGGSIDIDALVAESKLDRWDESVGLDVIGSWEGSRKNMDYMREAQSPAMPVFHIGEPWDLLDYYCEKWSKVGLACSVLKGNAKAKHQFYDQCFAKAWPHQFHSFGWTQTKMLQTYPFHSADSSSWLMGPMGFGNWKKYGRVRGLPGARGKEAMRGEIVEYIQLQAQLETIWSRELQQLAA